MSGLKFEFDWIDSPCRTSPALAATMARLTIRVDDEVVTRVWDKTARTVRDWIVTPLAPVAEWISLRWWALLDESETSSRSSSEFRNRHVLTSAEEGFVLPSLRFVSEQDFTRLEWQPRPTRFASVDFESKGKARLARGDVRRSLSEFVDGVVARLEQQGATDSTVCESWNAIRETTVEEESFCRMAGRLGLDPYDLDPARSGKLLAAAHQIWPSLLDEFSCSICEPQLEASLGWILEGQRQLQLHSSSSTDSTFFCPEISAATLPIPAWSRGYEIARKFRQQQQLSDQEPLAVMPLLQGEQLLPAESNDGDSGLEALVSVTEPMIYASKSWHPRSRKFQNARALFARVSASQSCASPCNAALLTTAHTAWQQMSRAFAAELLVPAAFLRGSLSKEIVRQDEISDIADSLEISTWVVEHQIRNHRLAQIESFVE